MQRQSFEGANGIPDCSLPQTGTEAAPLPQPSQDMVGTPFGRMGRLRRATWLDAVSTSLCDRRKGDILMPWTVPIRAMGKTAQNQIEERSSTMQLLARLA